MSFYPSARHFERWNNGSAKRLRGLSNSSRPQFIAANDWPNVTQEYFNFLALELALSPITHPSHWSLDPSSLGSQARTWNELTACKIPTLPGGYQWASWNHWSFQSGHLVSRESSGACYHHTVCSSSAISDLKALPNLKQIGGSAPNTQHTRIRMHIGTHTLW